ncbi:MAG: phosphonoacetate hydrolase [Bradymonadia bacterium]|jgi:phosphonoacetate hydrolase
MPITPYRFVLLAAALGCTDLAPLAELDAAPDAVVAAAMDAAADAVVDAARDAATDMAIDSGLDAGLVDGADVGIDMAPPVCSAPPESPPAPTGPLPVLDNPHRGIDSWEAAAWDQVRAAAQADPGVHFVATFDHAADALVIDGAGGQRVEARRVDGRWTVTAGALADIFASTENGLYPSLSALLEAFEPYPEGREAQGYAPNDPRVGGLPLDAQSWPRPLVRLGTLFDAEHAPDGVIGLYPWARGGGGTHGGLGLLQSRASLILAGKGARRGRVSDAAALVDVGPTVLAALGAPTTDGIGPDGQYDGGLYMRRQDGRVLWEALAEDPCDRPRHVVVLLFDGLMANELNHQVLAEDPEVDLPTLRALAAEGVVYDHGAVSGFPSMSAPGHMTVGTGVWPGHHGIVNNYFWDRAAQARVAPLAFVNDPLGFVRDPRAAFAFHDVYVPPQVETLAAAAHRAFGDWDADARTGAYVAVISDIPVGDADFTTADYLLGERSKALANSRVADDLAILQATTLLGTPAAPVPTILQVGFGSTDSAGETNGPHSPLVREVLVEMDRRVARLVASYDRAGALDDTLFVLVSDHGIELQDPTRATSFARVLQAADVRTSEASFGLVYLRVLEGEAQPMDDGFQVTVRHHDTGAPVPDVMLSCPSCAPIATDAQGQAWVASTIELVGAHPDFNRLRLDQ